MNTLEIIKDVLCIITPCLQRSTTAIQGQPLEITLLRVNHPDPSTALLGTSVPVSGDSQAVTSPGAVCTVCPDTSEDFGCTFRWDLDSMFEPAHE